MPMPPGQGPLRVALTDWWKSLDPIGRLKRWWAGYTAGFMLHVNEYNQEIGRSIDTEGTIPRGPIERWLGTKATDPLIGALFAFLGLFRFAWDGLQISATPWLVIISREMNRISRPKRLDAGAMFTAKDRVPEQASLMQAYLAEEGYDDLSLRILEELHKDLLGARDYFEAWSRGVLTETELVDKLHRLSFADAEINYMKANFPQLLGVGQVIDAAQRRANDTAYAANYGLDEGITPDFFAAMRKLHYEDNEIVQLWRLSRTLPNLGQAVEMRARLREGESELPFTDDDLNNVLAAQGVPGYFRDRLKAIAEPAYPRLIISGLYRAGQLTADEVLSAVKDMGYRGERAAKVAAYLTRDAKSDRQGLSRDAIIKAYSRGIYTEQETHDGLIAIGLSEEDAAFYLALADHDLQAQMTDVQLTVIQNKYVNGVIDETGLAAELGHLNLPSERVTQLEQLWNIQRNNKTNVPGRSELDDLLRRGIIDHTVYHDTLHRDGYEEATIAWFSLRIDQIIAADAAAELAGKQAEQQRLSTATLRTSYQTFKADNAVKIAQLRSAIADIQLALHSITNTDQVKALKAQIADYQNQIVHLNEDAANLYSEFLAASAPPGG